MWRRAFCNPWENRRQAPLPVCLYALFPNNPHRQATKGGRVEGKKHRVIVPGSTGSAGSEVCTRQLLTDTDQKQLKIFYVYIWGDVEYLDIFNEPHRTLFCDYRLADDTGGFLQCPFNNDAN